MLRYAIGVSSAVLLAALVAQPAAAAPWTKSYVVGYYEYAFRYGGRADYDRPGTIEPGVDCPGGNTVHFANPTETAKALRLVSWRTSDEIEKISTIPGIEFANDPNGPRFSIWQRAISFRAYRPDIQSYVNPWAVEDPGQPQVSSRIGEGFNLDRKIKDSDFVSPDGEKGVDNALYRAWGCDAPWRGNGNATLTLRSNDKMQEGLYTVVVRISGNQDPMNDTDATLEVGYSPDKLVKDARGATAQDYSYRIVKTEQYSKLKAKVVDGVVETEQADIHMPQIAWFPNQVDDANFRNGKIRLSMNPDGTATAMVGGYRDWRDLYAQNTFAQDGSQQGIREHEDHVALYYALRRNADGLFNEKTKQFDGISSAYRLKLAQAHVVDPVDATMRVPRQPVEAPRKAAYEAIRKAVIVGAETRIPQLVPPGTTEGGRGLVRDLKDMPTRDYFLTLLALPSYMEAYPNCQRNPNCSEERAEREKARRRVVASN
jgi:hypothetical protein